VAPVPAWHLAEERMPKQLNRGNAARNVVVQVRFDQVHCRDLDQLLQHAGDNTRLRGDRRQSELELKTLPHADTVIRRLFSRDQIAAERLAVRAALARAAHNLTPERLRTLGSPGRLAVLDLQHAASLGLDRDIRAGQVRSAAAMLARDRKKRSVMSSPVKARSAWLAKKGTNTLTSAEGARRVQLRAFCMDNAARGRLPALLAESGDKPAEIAASISMFQAEAITFAIDDMLGGKRDPRSPTGQSGKSADSQLLRLFIQCWRRASQAGKISSATFPWFDAVDWLVNRLNGARPTSPGATRAPKSPRVISPAATLRRAQTAAPTSPLRQPSTPAPAPAKRAVTRRLITVSSATPQRAQPQNGRQSASIRMLNQLQSPTRLADTPVPSTAVATATHTGTMPVLQPTVERTITREPVLPLPAMYRDPASAVPISQAAPLGPTASLLDLLLEYIASQNLETPDGGEGGSQIPGSLGDATLS
jgi:hypothetical protein